MEIVIRGNEEECKNAMEALQSIKDNVDIKTEINNEDKNGFRLNGFRLYMIKNNSIYKIENTIFSKEKVECEYRDIFTGEKIKTTLEKNGNELSFDNLLTVNELLEKLDEEKKKCIGFNYTDHNACLEAVKHNGYALRYVKEQTPDICLEAVKQNGCALQFVKEQTPEICLEAVKQNEYALAFVKKQTEDICLAAVKKQDGFNNIIEFIDIDIMREIIRSTY